MTDAPRPGQPPANLETFEALYRQHYRGIVGFFIRRGVPTVEARDLAQEVFVRAYSAIDRYRGEAPSRWLFAIARNTLANTTRFHRAKKREGEVTELDIDPAADLVASPDPSSLDLVLSNEDQKKLRQAIERLPELMRRSLLLRIGSDLTYREIAAVTGRSIETVKSLLHEARQRLRADLGR